MIFYNISWEYIYFYFSVKSDFKVYLPSFLQTNYSSTSYFKIYHMRSSVLDGLSRFYISKCLLLLIKGDSNKFSKLFSMSCWALFILKNSEVLLISDIFASISSKLKFSLNILFCFLFFSSIIFCLLNNKLENISLLFCWCFST